MEEKDFYTTKGAPHYPKFGELWPTTGELTLTACKARGMQGGH